jgi:hypothetical protein
MNKTVSGKLNVIYSGKFMFQLVSFYATTYVYKLDITHILNMKYGRKGKGKLEHISSANGKLLQRYKREKLKHKLICIHFVCIPCSPFPLYYGLPITICCPFQYMKNPFSLLQPAMWDDELEAYEGRISQCGKIKLFNFVYRQVSIYTPWKSFACRKRQ